jgi:hypothetical protein
MGIRASLTIVRLLGLKLSIPDHTTPCRRAETLQVFNWLRVFEGG